VNAREDKAQVRRLYRDLKGRGFNPWLDEFDLIGGQLWKTEIPKAIREAEIFLACLSRLTNLSRNSHRRSQRRWPSGESRLR
jgi:hypothetical protein